MGEGQIRSSSRTLPVAVAIIALLYNLSFATICTYLPYDPLYLGQSISIYAWAGCALSLVGIVGIAKRRSTLVISFAHYLLLDTLLSAVCRLFLLQLFADEFSDQDICSGAFTNTLAPDSLRHDHGGAAGAHRQHHAYRPKLQMRRCRIALDAAQIILVGFVVASTAAQCMLAIGMRRYGKELERWAPASCCEALDDATSKRILVGEKV
ncbi:hypothetical protein B0A50_03115 [Salinomyces thailandicus]|uniref:Uncharacterized protein n=1 Tax=Salinomyces thailandicus TaxID=706561 RepID=A0A4U0U598_9PEZI|nr:hypothetical protein B0A50_03115 [Salinomyces thailandica]